MALKAARIALAESGIDPAGLGMVVGSGTGDVATHHEIQEKLLKYRVTTKVSATVIPKIMASTVSANLVNALHTRGPSVTATARRMRGARKGT